MKKLKTIEELFTEFSLDDIVLDILEFDKAITEDRKQTKEWFGDVIEEKVLFYKFRMDKVAKQETQLEKVEYNTYKSAWVALTELLDKIKELK